LVRRCAVHLKNFNFEHQVAVWLLDLFHESLCQRDVLLRAPHRESARSCIELRPRDPGHFAIVRTVSFISSEVIDAGSSRLFRSRRRIPAPSGVIISDEQVCSSTTRVNVRVWRDRTSSAVSKSTFGARNVKAGRPNLRRTNRHTELAPHLFVGARGVPRNRSPAFLA